MSQGKSILVDMPSTTVAFNGGAYGNYVFWIIYTLCVDDDIRSPFDQSTSHNWDYINPAHVNSGAISTKFFDGVTVTCDDIVDHQLSLIHPVTDFNQQFDTQLRNISHTVDRVIVPYCDHATYLLGVNNYMYKIWPNTWSGPLQYVDRQNLKDGWGVNIDADLNNIPRWILREHHSINVFDSWQSQCGWFAPERTQPANCKFIFVHDLFYDFLNAIESIRQHLGVTWCKDPQELLPLHQQNIHSQQYKNQDSIAQCILDSVCNNTNYTWNNTDITLYTEAYIQRRLQQLGYMLKCNELNVFPTSTNELLEACA